MHIGSLCQEPTQIQDSSKNHQLFLTCTLLQCSKLSGLRTWEQEEQIDGDMSHVYDIVNEILGEKEGG